jgi:hypothetical protein
MTDQPQISREEMLREIGSVTARLKEIQTSRSLSDRDLVDEYPDLGSTKTWKQRLVAGNLEGLNLERTYARMRRIAVLLTGEQPDEVFYRDLPFAREMAARVAMLEQQTNDRRIFVCLAPNGVGKSAGCRYLVGQSRARRVAVRMLPTWRNKLLHIYTGICSSLGQSLQTTNVAEAERHAIALLRGHPHTLFVDQAHEGGVALMHILRALVDETPSRFVYLAYFTAFRSVQTGSTDALVEAKAFLGRCLKPIFDLYQDGTHVADVALYLRRAAGLTAAAAEGVANKVTPILQATANLRLLDDAIASARAADDSDDARPDAIVAEVYRLSGLCIEHPQKTAA